MIGDDVKVIIVDVRGDKVRLGIEAPKEIPVHRMEIYEAIQREKAEAKAAEAKAAEGKAEAAEGKAEAAEGKPEKTAKKQPEEDPESHVEEEAAEPVVKKRTK